jgi:hypothetical protein
MMMRVPMVVTGPGSLTGFLGHSGIPPASQ